MKFIYKFFFFYFLISSLSYSQNEGKKWIFGRGAALDFLTSPPTLLSLSSMTTQEGCSSIADGTGNLLFYTDGINIWNKAHQLMANGSGLTGNSSSSQSALIAKKPGSCNLYYVFTTGINGNSALAYSIIDMSLAASMGSVTTKNNTLAINCTEKLTGVIHRNGTDIWIISHSFNSADFKVFLLTASGVNTTAVVSNIGSVHASSNNYAGCMKTSVDGKKLGLAIIAQNTFELFDFNNTNGIVTNSISLFAGFNQFVYGCEFSPDASKFYGTGLYNNGCIYQWDLSLGTATAIASSKYTVFTSTNAVGALQLATDKKIYAARASSTLGIIYQPNLPGASCNYNDNGFDLSPGKTDWSLPNFITSTFSKPITYNNNCFGTEFYSSLLNSLFSSCQNTLTNYLWHFGDPTSGIANTSTLSNPIHTYSVIGTYTTMLILNYCCGGGTDTLVQAITISSVQSNFNLNIAGNFSICSGEKSNYLASGASSFYWNIGSTSTSITLSPNSTTTYTLIGMNADKSCSQGKTFTILVNPCTEIKEQDLIVNENFKIFPNPFKNQLFIQNKTTIEIEILNQDGKSLVNKVFEPGENEINIALLNDGLYFLKAITSISTITKRVIKISD